MRDPRQTRDHHAQGHPACPCAGMADSRSARSDVIAALADHMFKLTACFAPLREKLQRDEM